MSTCGRLTSLALWTLVLKLWIGQVSSNDSDALRLVQDVTKLQAVMKSIHPDMGQQVQVWVTFFPMSVIALVEKEQRFTVSGWFYVTWNDVFLRWSPQDYGNISRIYVAHEQIWKPDLMVINGADDLQSVSGTDTDLAVSSDGRVEWFPGNVFSATCRMDLTSFPFDRQDCYFQMSSWLYTTETVSLNPHIYNPIRNDSWRENSEWALEGLYCRLKNQTSDGRLYSHVEYHFVLKRRSAFYVLKYLAPVGILSLVSTFVFCVPPQSGEKVSLAVSTMLSLTVFLAYLTDITPSNSDTVPEVAIFVVLHLTLGACGVVGNILLLKVYFYRLHRSNRQRRGLTRTLWASSVEEEQREAVENVTAEQHRKDTLESLWATDFHLDEDLGAETVLRGSSSASFSGRPRSTSFAPHGRGRDLNGISTLSEIALSGLRGAPPSSFSRSFSDVTRTRYFGFCKRGGYKTAGRGRGVRCSNDNPVSNLGVRGHRRSCRDGGALGRRLGRRRSDDVHPRRHRGNKHNNVIDDDDDNDDAYDDTWVGGTSAAASACSVHRLGSVCFVVFLLVSALVSAVFFGRNVN